MATSIKIAAGELRSQIIFQANDPSSNSSGGGGDNFVDGLITRGRLRKRTGRKMDDSGQLVFQDGYELIVRYSASVPLDSDSRVLIDDIIYSISTCEIIFPDKPQWVRMILFTNLQEGPA